MSVSYTSMCEIVASSISEREFARLPLFKFLLGPFVDR